MSGAKASRYVCGGAILLTLIMLLIAAGPFGNHRASGDVLASLLLLPILGAWSVGPYAVANKFAQDAEGGEAWIYVAVQLLAGPPVLAIYIDAYILTPDADPQSGLAFAILPLYQFVAVLAAIYGVRLWRRFM